MNNLILTNARIVTRDEVVLGTLVVEHGRIVSVDRGQTSMPGSIDVAGDIIIPGLIELHTDNMEKRISPRPGVKWPTLSAAIAHDVQVVGAGITTVFDALSVGDIMYNSIRFSQLKDMSETISRAKKDRLFRADHFFHMRCELSYEAVVDLFNTYVDNALVRLVSVMDHAPGQRHYKDVSKYRAFYQGKYHFSDKKMDLFIENHQRISNQYSHHHRREIVKICKSYGLPMASHDDTTRAHVDEALLDGMCICEFPTTDEAALAARDKGLSVVMGAPNMVRGRSQSEHISARDLALQGAVNILSSDYFPGSILQGVFTMLQQIDGISLPDAVATATLNPAKAAGMTDRGEIRPGKRADLVRVRVHGDMPIVREVWSLGERIF